MRNKFDEQLKLLNEELNEMGALCESAIANSAKALLTGLFQGVTKLRQNVTGIPKLSEEREVITDKKWW